MITNVVGVTSPNDDGSSRKNIIAAMSDSDEIFLEREPTNPYDRNAIKVCVIKNGRNLQIGYIKKEIAIELAPRMDNDEKFTVEVLDCGVGNYPYCKILIEEED